MKKLEAKQRKAHCLCGEIVLETVGEMRTVMYCHCEQCRKSHGHFAAFTKIDETQLTIHDHNNNIQWYNSSNFAKRAFCKNCGSRLFYKMNQSSAISIAAGLFGDEAKLKASDHIFVKDKAHFYQISDDLTQHDTFSQSVL